MTHQETKLTIDDIGKRLGHTPQSLLEAAEVASSQYLVFDVPKVTGGVRTICAPKDELKYLQRSILVALLQQFYMPEHVHGCVKGRSIATNAAPHVSKPLVLTIDLKDFFGSIKPERVKQIFAKQFDCDDECAELLTRLTTFGNFLPQGTPTSPTLANIAALEMDQALLQILSDSGLQFAYTRYVDDITISGDNRLGVLLAPLYTAIKEHGFAASPKKLKVSRPANRQKVTGIVVNKRMGPPKKLIRKIRQQLYYCEKFGVENHCEKEGLVAERFLNEINGMLGFIRLTQPVTADLFKMRLDRLNKFELVDTLQHIWQVLMHAVRAEQHVLFIHDDTSCKVAPVEIYIDDDGHKYMRGYQTIPEPGWKHYNIADIKSLELVPQ